MAEPSVTGAAVVDRGPGDPEPAIKLVGIDKRFPGVHALKGVDLDLMPGEVHALVGENGAGKSTLIKILAGVHRPDGGHIVARGEPRAFFSGPHEAREAGLAFVFQELNVVEHLEVADNLTLGLESARVAWDRPVARRIAREALERLEIALDPSQPMRKLRPAERQLVMIARALSTGASVIVMDEPTAALTDDEITVLFDVIRRLRSQGVALLYVSHRLDEVFELADRITVFRDGARVDTRPRSDYDRSSVVADMVGRVLDTIYEHPPRTRGPEALRLEHVAGAHGRVRDASLTLHGGEVLGIAGIVGSGRTELARIIFGAEPLEGGEMWLWEKGYRPADAKAAIRQGVGLLPEERRSQGIVGVLSVRENISLAASGRVSRLGMVDRKADRELAEQFRQLLNIRTPSVERPIRLLSGGNQQKVVLAKWLAVQGRVLLLDEPTRGVDVGAKAEIFSLINQLTEQGDAILMISSELEEIIGFCDRVAVMRDGVIVTTLEGAAIDRERVMHLATGGE